MESSRDYKERRKERIIFVNKDFPIMNDLQIGDTGYMNMTAKIEEMFIEPDDNNNDLICAAVDIESAEIIIQKKSIVSI